MATKLVIAALAIAASLGAAEARTAIIKSPCQDMGDGRILFDEPLLPDWARAKLNEAGRQGRNDLVPKMTILSSVRADESGSTDAKALANLDARIARGEALGWPLLRLCTIRVRD